MRETHVPRGEVQRCGIKEWREDVETTWNERHRDSVLWGAGFADMTAKVHGTARVGEAARTDDVRKEQRDNSTRQHSDSLEASQLAGAVQCGEPDERQLQQQPNQNPDCNSNCSLNSNANSNPSKHLLRPGGGRQSNLVPRVIGHPLAQALP